MPVPSVSSAASRAPARRAEAPLGEHRGVARRCRRTPAARAARPSRSRNGTSASGRLAAMTATPRRWSMRHGIPMPTRRPRAAPLDRVAHLARSPSTTVSSTCLVGSAAAERGRRDDGRSGPASTAPARSFVPPRSTPITQPVDTSATIHRHAGHPRPPRHPTSARRPTERPSTASTARAAAARGRGGGGCCSTTCARRPPPRRRRRRPRSARAARRHRQPGASCAGSLGAIAAWLVLVAGRLPGQRADPGPAGPRRRPSRRWTAAATRLVAAQHDPRARLRPAHGGHARSRARSTSGPSRADTILLMRSAAARTPALDRARHGRRHPRRRAQQDQRRLRDRRHGAGGRDDRAVPRHRHQPRRSR